MLYFGLYDEDGATLDGPLLIAPHDAVSILPDGLRLAVGSGAQIMAEAAAGQNRKIEPARTTLQPSALALAEIVLETGETTANLRPLYLRPPDAKPQATAIGRR
jgi:tRNA A37 threonylcarbamoyladenosine modification protein TsaB